MLDGTKSALKSRGVWGGVVSILAFVLGFLGYTLSDADQSTLTMLLPGIVSGIGGVMAIVGRVFAKQKIG